VNKVARRRQIYRTQRSPSSYGVSVPSSWKTLSEPWPGQTGPRPVLTQADLRCADCKGPVGYLPFTVNHPETFIVRCRPCFDYRRAHNSRRPV
jgi:hypothetical protein